MKKTTVNATKLLMEQVYRIGKTVSLSIISVLLLAKCQWLLLITKNQ